MSGPLDLTLQRLLFTPKVAGGGVVPQFTDDIVILGLIALGVLDCIADADEPGDTTKLWHDLSGQSSTAPGLLKAYSGGAWTALTPALLADHLVSKSNLSNLTTPIPIASGGTASTSASSARTNLGLAINSDVQAYSAILAATTASFTTALETRLNALDSAVVLQGGWDASAGTFPGGGTAQAGDSYQVTTGGTVDSTAFSINDRIIAIADNASTSTYASNWLKADYSDVVASVAGLTGAIGSAALLTALSLDNVLKSDTSDRIETSMGFAIKTDTSSSGTLALNFSDSCTQSVTLSENITTITITGATAGDDLKVYFIQAAGLYTVAGWPGTVSWMDGAAVPTITATDGAKDIIYLEYDGTDYLGSYKQNG